MAIWATGLWAPGLWADGLWASAAVAPTVTTTTLPDGQVGVAYSATLTATGDGPITWAVTVGTLPDGLSLDANTGVISGTPTTEIVAGITVEATNAEGSDTQDLTLTIVAAVSDEQPSGGWAAYNAYDAERQRRRRKQLEDEEDELEALADRLEAQLASEGLLEAYPVVAQRIVVREYAQSPELLNRRAQRAVDYALRAKTELAWQLAAREIAHQEEDEELALLLLLAAA